MNGKMAEGLISDNWRN